MTFSSTTLMEIPPATPTATRALRPGVVVGAVVVAAGGALAG